MSESLPGRPWLSIDTSSDYATWLNMEENITSNAIVCDYNMV